MESAYKKCLYFLQYVFYRDIFGLDIPGKEREKVESIQGNHELMIMVCLLYFTQLFLVGFVAVLIISGEQYVNK